MTQSEAILHILQGVEAFAINVSQQALSHIKIAQTTDEWLSLAQAAKRLGYEDRNATKEVKKLCKSGELIFRKKSDNENAQYQVWSVSIELYQAKSILELIPDKPHFAPYRQQLIQRVQVLERTMN